MTCNQHAKHQVAKGGIPSNPPLNQLVTSPRFKNLPSASEPLTSQFVSAFFSTKYRTTSCLPASTWDPRHYLGPLGRWCKDVEKFNCRHLGSFKMVDFFFEDTIGDVWGWYVTIIYYNIILYNPATGTLRCSKEWRLAKLVNHIDGSSPWNTAAQWVSWRKKCCNTVVALAYFYRILSVQ